MVTRELVARSMLVDQLALTQGLAAIVGYLAQRLDKTPRQIHDQLFKTAPSDEWWRAKIGRDEGDRP